MTDLIFHIGLPKCASTTLQRNVFQNETGYLGTCPGMPANRNFAKSIMQCGPFSGRQTTNFRLLDEWAERLWDLKRNDFPSENRLILSNETLAASSKFQHRPIIPMLEHLRKTWTHGKIRVVIAFRNQVERIASTYAQRSRTILHPTQEGFERFVARTLTRDFQSWDYGAWVGGLYDVLGEENVCVLFVEESDTVDFWECLREFAQVSNNTSHSLVAVSRNRRNVRRTTGESWKISEFDPRFSGKVAVNKVFNLLWPHRKFPEVRETVRSWLVSATCVAIKASSRALAIAPRQEAICLTPEIENAIQQKVHDCNARLASLVGRDLSEIGYL